MMDPWNFGNCRASELLVIHIENNNQIRHKICRMFHNFARGLQQIEGIKDNNVFERTALFWTKEYEKSIDTYISLHELDDHIARCFKSCIVAQYRNKLRDRKIIPKKEYKPYDAAG